MSSPRAVSEAATTLADLHEVPSLFELAYQQALTESDPLELCVAALARSAYVRSPPEEAETLYDFAWAQAANTQAQECVAHAEGAS